MNNNFIPIGTRVYRKYFWYWIILEIFNNDAIVRFENPKIWLRKCKLTDLIFS